LDTIPIEESSIRIEEGLKYHFESLSNSIFLDTEIDDDSITVCFRSLPLAIYEPIFQRNINTYSQGRISTQKNISSIPIIPKEEIFSFTDFETSGAITRGVTFGNRQNLFVNSALNLQLEGQLAEDLFVSASITDQNIPYQPDGNTQQIRDFDNVFIKLYNDKFSLIAGDVVLTNPVKEGYFLKYYKNVQGLNFEYKYSINEKWKARSVVSGAAAKGQFSSSQLAPIEGVQGPYKLTGPNGERFIIVLSNSERVFIDGKLMERGFDRDYVIDYNLGEVTFSNTVVITRFTRIRIDFEYAEQYYSRSNLNATQEITDGKWKFYANYYQEKDNPHNTLGFDVSQSDLDQLQALGDNGGIGEIDGAEAIDFVENAILYQRKDTLVGANLIVIYQRSVDPKLAQYRVAFTEVGVGKGDYVLNKTTLNGREYEWVAPIGGIHQGLHAPVRILPLPNKRQMMVLGGNVKLSEHEVLQNELAVSNQDRNLYSSLDDRDNEGLAWKTSIKSEGRTFGDYKAVLGASYESLDQNFTWIDRFRSIEYDRNWGYNIAGDSAMRSDHIVLVDAALTKDENNSLRYDFSYRNRAGVIDGLQNGLEVTKELGMLRSHTSGFLMKNNTSNLFSEWYRLKQDLRLNGTKINPGYAFVLDQQRTYLADTLYNSLMHYYSHDFYLMSGDSSKTTFRADYIKRYDQLPLAGEMMAYTNADELKLGMRAHFLKTQIINLTGNYRQIDDKINGSTDTNILGKLDWQSHFWKERIKRNFSYSTATIRELRREFVYVNVPTGAGTHTWRDENGDGVQDLNEFYEAINADEKNYAKIFSPTDQYINAFQTTFLNTIDMIMPREWANRGGFIGQISKVSFSSNARINFKSTESNLISRINPFADLESNSMIGAQTSSRYGLFYNRNGTGLAYDISRTSNRNKSLLTNGFELRERLDWQANLRFNFQQTYTVRLQGSIGDTRNASDFLATRNFVLSRYSWAPQLLWQPNSAFRISGKVERRAKQQMEAENPAHSSLSDFSVESTWVRANKGNLNAQMQWISIAFDGEQNSYLGYELLEGLQPGQNQKWNLNWQQSLNKGLQLTLQYNGRKSNSSAPVHTGTMQLTAFF
jgi:hypothetical protein